MRASNYDFPHPVLFSGNDDYIGSTFSIAIKERNNENNYSEFCFDVQYSLKSEGLASLIKEGKADVILRIESPATSFRKMYKLSLGNQEINLSKKLVAEKIIIKGFIVAAEDISDFFFPNEHNRDYFSFPFKVKRGEILAYEQGTLIYLDASELERPVSSIIVIAENEVDDEPIHISLEGNKIEVFLSKDSYKAYWNLRRKHDLKKYLIGLVVYPAVIEALNQIKAVNAENVETQYEPCTEKKWYRVIVHKLHEKGIEKDNITDMESSELANTLLGNIVNRSLESLNETFENEFDGSDTDAMGGND